MNLEESQLELYNVFELTLKDLDMCNRDEFVAQRIHFYYVLLKQAKIRFQEHMNRE
jgi:hypothetical protein